MPEPVPRGDTAKVTRKATFDDPNRLGPRPNGRRDIKLWQAFWLLFLVPLVLMIFLNQVVTGYELQHGSQRWARAVSGAFFLYLVWALVVVWRSASTSIGSRRIGRRVGGYLAKFYVVSQILLGATFAFYYFDYLTGGTRGTVALLNFWAQRTNAILPKPVDQITELVRVSVRQESETPVFIYHLVVDPKTHSFRWDAEAERLARRRARNSACFDAGAKGWLDRGVTLRYIFSNGLRDVGSIDLSGTDCPVMP